MNVSTWCMWSACLLGLDRQYLQSCCSWEVELASLFSSLSSLLRSVFCWSSSPPAPIHSRLCVTVLPTLHPGAFLVTLCSSPEQCDIKLDRRKAISPQRSLCQSSVALFFPWWPFGWIPSPHQHTPACSGDLLPPCSARAVFCWRVPFFVVSVTKVLLLRWTLPYTLIFQQMKERATL